MWCVYIFQFIPCSYSDYTTRSSVDVSTVIEIQTVLLWSCSEFAAMCVAVLLCLYRDFSGNPYTASLRTASTGICMALCCLVFSCVLMICMHVSENTHTQTHRRTHTHRHTHARTHISTRLLCSEAETLGRWSTSDPVTTSTIHACDAAPLLCMS